MRSFGRFRPALVLATALLAGTVGVLNAPSAFAAGAPGVAPTTASNLVGTSATLKADISPNGLSTTVTAVCTGGPAIPSSTVVSGSGVVPTTVTLTGLTGAGNYICSLKATNSAGSDTGASKASFYAADPPLTPVTLFVDGSPDFFGGGTKTTGCTGPGPDACMTVQQGVAAAQALTNSSVTLQVIAKHGFPGDNPYFEGVNIALPHTVRLRIQGVNNPIIGGQLQNDSVFDIVGGTGLSGANARVVLDGLTIKGGQGTGNAGGGVTVRGDLVELRNNTITENRSAAGAGVYNNSTNQLTLVNNTITANIADFGTGTGLAVFTLQGSTLLIHNTLADNPPSGPGTGLDKNVQGSYRLVNSILSRTTCGNFSASTDGGRNVESGNTCGLSGATNVVGSAGIGLAALAENGSTGPKTLAIGAGSSAHNEVPAAACTISTDQRGFSRPGFAGQGCDAGAFELQAPPVGPTVGGTSSSAVTATTASLTATVNPGGANTTATATCSGGPFTASTDGVGAGRAGVPATVTLTGLSAATDYSCKITVSSTVGNAESEMAAPFTTGIAAPTVDATNSAAVTASTASVSAALNPNGDATNVTADCTGGPFTPAPVSAGTTASTYTVALTGLNPGVTYTCAIRATNGQGTTTSASPATFATGAAQPSVGETSSSGVGIGVATVSAQVNPNAGATTVTATCTGGPFTAATVAAGSGTSAATRSVALSGLTAGTPYSCALTATNGAGTTTSGSPANFSTAAAIAPSVTATTVSGMTDTSASLESVVNPNGAATSVTATCTGGQFTASSQNIDAGTDPVNVTVALTGLKTGTAYSCRVSATNSVNSTISATPADFTTASLQPPPGAPGSNGSASATSTTPSGNAVANRGGVTASGHGVGALTVSTYNRNTRANPPFRSTDYFDVQVADGSAFTSLTIVAEDLNGGDTLYWFDDAAVQWKAVSPSSYDAATKTITVTLSSTSTPTIAQLTGTVFGVGKARAKTKVHATAIKAKKGESRKGKVATFTDADDSPARAYKATISWGDGTTSKGKVVRTGKGTYKVVGKHTYRGTGRYVTKVTVSDAGGRGSDRGRAKVVRRS